MHPFGFFAALLAADAQRTRQPRHRPADDPLPPIDDATLRAWRAWAQGDPAGRSTTVDAPRRAPAPGHQVAGRRADNPA